MSLASIMSPASALRVTYPDPQSIETLYNLAVTNVFAPTTDAGVAQSLLIGASSNVIIESSADAMLFLQDTSEFQVYQSKFDGQGIRQDNQILDLTSGLFPDGVTSGTVLSTGMDANPMWVYGSDANHTTWISSTKVRNLNSYTQFSTTQSDGFIFNNQVSFSSNTTFAQDVYMKSALEVDGNVTMYGNLFSKNMNLWQDSLNGVHDRVGFGFSINSNSQLELIKYAQFPDGTSLTKKVAVFGASPMLPTELKDSPQSYLVFDQLTGIGVHNPETQTSSGGASSTSTTAAAFQFSPTGDISTSASFGIGVTNPQFPLDVLGTINSTSLQALNITATNVTTTSDERLKDIAGTVEPSLCLDRIKQLEIIDFSYISSLAGVSTTHQTGLRAQQVASVMADAVVTKSFAGLDDCKMIDSSVMLAYVIGAIKELASKIV